MYLKKTGESYEQGYQASKKWESDGLIDHQQVDMIIEFETGSGTSYTIYGLIMLGITVLFKTGDRRIIP